MNSRYKTLLVPRLLMAFLVLFLPRCAKINPFQLPPDYPVIDSITPATGRIGTELHVYGSGFSTQPNLDSFTINGVSVQVQAATSTVLLATVSSNTGTGHVALSVGGQQAQGPIFTYNQNAVSLNSLTPSTGWTDTVVTLRGVGFGNVQDSVLVTFNGVPATIQRFSDTLIVVLTPQIPGINGAPVMVMVKVGGQLSNGLPYTYTQGAANAPTIQVILAAGRQPDYFALGDTIYIHGKYFGTQQPAYTVEVWTRDGLTHFSPDPSLLSWTDTLIAGVIPNWSSNLANGTPLTVYVREGATYATDTADLVVAGSVGQSAATLSVAREYLAAAGAGNYILFAGGYYSGGLKSDAVDLYNIGTQAWSTAKLSQPRDYLAGAAAGTKIVFAGGTDTTGNNSSAVDIFDVNNGAWATSILPKPGLYPVGASTGSKIVIVAEDQISGVGSFVNIYDVSTGVWTTSHLSESGISVVAAGSGGKIAFSGFSDPVSGLPVATVDIYDVNTGTWSQAQLSQARTNLAAAAAGNKIVFAGGYSYASSSASNVVDIFDVSTGTWTTGNLSAARPNLAGAGAGSKILFAGGLNGTEQGTVDIYDVNTGQWTTAILSKYRYAMAGAGTGNVVIFGGGLSSGTLQNAADIFAF